MPIFGPTRLTGNLLMFLQSKARLRELLPTPCRPSSRAPSGTLSQRGLQRTPRRINFILKADFSGTNGPQKRLKKPLNTFSRLSTKTRVTRWRTLGWLTLTFRRRGSARFLEPKSTVIIAPKDSTEKLEGTVLNSTWEEAPSPSPTKSRDITKPSAAAPSPGQAVPALKSGPSSNN